tara:strand:- start:322 stop:549 length:228 start_codon:yes stop_codon:yes gene_type:complete
MCDADIVEVKTTVQKFAEKEHLGAPLNTMLHARFPQELAVFLRTAALTEGVSESTVIRYACTQWATAQGYHRGLQ